MSRLDCLLGQQLTTPIEWHLLQLEFFLRQEPHVDDRLCDEICAAALMIWQQVSHAVSTSKLETGMRANWSEAESRASNPEDLSWRAIEVLESAVRVIEQSASDANVDGFERERRRELATDIRRRIDRLCKEMNRAASPPVQSWAAALEG